MHKSSFCFLLSLCAVTAFVPSSNTGGRECCRHIESEKLLRPAVLSQSTRTATLFSSIVPSDVSTDDGAAPSNARLDDLKAELVRLCSIQTDNNKPLLTDVQAVVGRLEEQAELVGIGQSSAMSGLLAGEWSVHIARF